MRPRDRATWLAAALALAAAAPAPAQDDGLDDLGLDDLLADVAGSSSAGGTRRGLRLGKGKVGAATVWYPHDRGGPGVDHRLLLTTDFELSADLAPGLTAFLRPRFLLDAADPGTRRTRPFEGYLQWSDSDWEVRAGILQENWGIADTSNPLDLVPRRDIAADLLEADRLGETGIRIRRFLKGRGRIGEPTLSAYVMTDLRDVPYPSPRSRLAEGAFTSTLGTALRPEGSDQVLYALRGQATVNAPAMNADVQLVLADGPERFPGVAARGTSFTTGYYGARTYGFGIRAVPNAAVMGRRASQLTLKLEVAYKDPYVLAGGLGTAPESYLAYTIGVDRPRSDVFRPKDSLTFMLEYAGETGAGDLNHHLRLFTDDVVLRWFWEANDLARRSVELRVIYDLDRTETVAQAIYEQQLRGLHDDLRLQIDVRKVMPDGQPPSIFGLIPDPTAVRVAFTYDF